MNQDLTSAQRIAFLREIREPSEAMLKAVIEGRCDEIFEPMWVDHHTKNWQAMIDTLIAELTDKEKTE